MRTFLTVTFALAWLSLSLGLGVSGVQAQGVVVADAMAPTLATVVYPFQGSVRKRPRVGLALSGGGARGLAHIGVLKVLEREHIPIDVIAGTSMGAVIGGLYASGMSAEALERALQGMDWGELFANRVPRELLSIRRKEEDFDISPAIEVGLHPVTGAPMLPLGSISSRGLEWLLRRYTLPVRQLLNFDVLPIPFRAVATDMETGQAVVFREGDLATALRASMSVPGVFPPTEVKGRILGDGGLVDNVPVDVVRAMGAEVVIAVNIGTPLAKRDALGSALGLTAQMLNILTEQNVQRSLNGLTLRRDILIEPLRGSSRFSSGDFSQVKELIFAGETSTEELKTQLQALALPTSVWRTRQNALSSAAPTPPPIANIRFHGTHATHPERHLSQMESQLGQPFDARLAERDSQRLAATDDYLHADYQLEDLPSGTGLVFNLEEKPWGPNYFRMGLALSSDFAGQGDFNIKLSHNRHWGNQWGGEWRNRLQIGSVPRWLSEWYQPLGGMEPESGTWFIAARTEGERRRTMIYPLIAPKATAQDVTMLERNANDMVRLGLDVGQTWGSLGEMRLGVQRDVLQITPESFTATALLATMQGGLRMTESALRFGLIMDQLDHPSFPTRGYRVKATWLQGQREVPTLVLTEGQEHFQRFELDATTVMTSGRHTLDTSLLLNVAKQHWLEGLAPYTLGGFQRLSGYNTEQLSGRQVALARMSYYARLNQEPVLTRGFFAGGSLEFGNAWRDLSIGLPPFDQWRMGTSFFLGADTGVGPLYFGLMWAPKGSSGLFLQLGRP
ncbi:MAG: patatin-like phospholipase family protein [Leptothrix ochracea]|uniref:patatin-like phospholipase family protein n=3 Tax=Leptothrix ochracea TaxID=735331 RepID=UPI0034E195CC